MRSMGVFLIALFVGCLSVSCRSRQIEIQGVVIAYAPCSVRGSEPPPEQFLLIQVEKVLAGKLESEYLVAAYEFGGDQFIDPKNFDGRTAWRFKLQADELESNVKFRDFLYVKLLDAETEKLIREDIRLTFLVDRTVIHEIGLDTTLPCFTFQEGEFKIPKKKI